MLKLNYKKIAGFIVSFSLVILLPIFLAHAQVGGDTTIQNPLGPGNDSVEKILGLVMDLVAKVGAIIVVFFIIYSGYKFVTARGNESEVTKAKEIFYATIIGGAILLGADVIANVVINTVNTTVGRS